MDISACQSLCYILLKVADLREADLCFETTQLLANVSGDHFVELKQPQCLKRE